MEIKQISANHIILNRAFCTDFTKIFTKIGVGKNFKGVFFGFWVQYRRKGRRYSEEKNHALCISRRAVRRSDRRPFFRNAVRSAAGRSAGLRLPVLRCGGSGGPERYGVASSETGADRFCLKKKTPEKISLFG